jgi:hypothetical protein
LKEKKSKREIECHTGKQSYMGPYWDFTWDKKAFPFRSSTYQRVACSQGFIRNSGKKIMINLESFWLTLQFRTISSKTLKDWHPESLISDIIEVLDSMIFELNANICLKLHFL